MIILVLDEYVIGWYNRANIFGRKNVIQNPAKKQFERIKGKSKKRIEMTAILALSLIVIIILVLVLVENQISVGMEAAR